MRFWQLKSFRLALACSALTGIILCFVPLFGVLGPESALVLGVVLPPFAATVGARRTALARAQGGATAGQLFADAIGMAWLLCLAPIVILAANAARVKTCAPMDGAAFLALGPVAGTTLAAVVGTAVGAFVRRDALANGLAIAPPLLAIAVAIHDFYTSPSIFAFGHFFGYFPGTFYDRRVVIPEAWLTLRAFSAVIGAALWAGVYTWIDPDTLRPSLPRARQHPITGLLTLAGGVCAALAASEAQALGFRTSSDWIAEKIGAVVEGDRCRIVVPRELDAERARRLALDCDFRVSQLERTLGVKQPGVITAYLFRNRTEKRKLMGAERVYIAKPWRQEVYLQLGGWPHPVLKHELAHIVAAQVGRGPFRIAGKVGGWIPEPTLIEGTAVALDFPVKDGLTPHQWAAAAIEAGVAPDLKQLLGPSFFGHNQGLAYTLAGSFLRHVLDTRGSAALRKLYGEHDIPEVLGADWAQLQQEWHQALKAIPMGAEDAARAQARFERPGVFSQVCPHEVERLRREISGALAANDAQRTIQTCRDVLDIDPNDTGVRATLVGALARDGQPKEAHAELAKLEGDPPASRPMRAHARSALADAAWLRGDFAEARRLIEGLQKEPQGEGAKRGLEVKALALDVGEPVRRWVGELLIARPGRTLDSRIAMHAIQKVREARNDGLADYLEARQLYGALRYDLALPLMQRALEKGLPTRRLRAEAWRQRGVAAFAQGELEDARTSFQSLAALPRASVAELAEAADWLERIRWTQQRGG